MMVYDTKGIRILIGREMVWMWQEGKRKAATPTPGPVVCGLWEIKVMKKGVIQEVKDIK